MMLKKHVMHIIPIAYDEYDDLIFLIKGNGKTLCKCKFKFNKDTLIIRKECCRIKSLDDAYFVLSQLSYHDFDNNIVCQNKKAKRYLKQAMNLWEKQVFTMRESLEQ